MSAAAEWDLDEAGDCGVAGCEKPATGPLCEMHERRRSRGIPMHQPARERLSPYARVLENCLALADVDTGDDQSYQLAIERLRKSLRTWFASLHATNLGRRGGRARAAALTAEQRTAQARAAAAARWGKQ